MIRIPPERVKVLTADELQRYGLSEDDPYDSAAREAEYAKLLGITVQELIQRRVKANFICSSSNREVWDSCFFRIVEKGQ
jgi:hypothetical protein